MKEIFIIDDYEGVRDSLNFILQKEGYRVRMATNGRKALDILSRKKYMPSLIILDLIMPVMDGYEVYLHFKSNPKYIDIPILIISGASENYVKFPFPASQTFLPKPYTVDELLKKVLTLIS